MKYTARYSKTEVEEFDLDHEITHQVETLEKQIALFDTRNTKDAIKILLALQETITKEIHKYV